MTSLEMQKEFSITVDKVDSSAFPELTKKEKYYFLNEGLIRFIKTRYQRNNMYGKGYEESQKRRDDLSAITLTRFIPALEANGRYEMNLNELYQDENISVLSEDKYMFFLRGSGKTIGGCKDWTKASIMDHDDYEEIKDDPFNQPTVDDLVILFEEGKIVTDVPTEKLKITFLAFPPFISDDQECVLAEHTHKEVVQMAATIALENIESQRLQTKSGVTDKTIE